jgi:hypothetical protein
MNLVNEVQDETIIDRDKRFMLRTRLKGFILLTDMYPDQTGCLKEGQITNLDPGGVQMGKQSGGALIMSKVKFEGYIRLANVTEWGLGSIDRAIRYVESVSGIPVKTTEEMIAISRRNLPRSDVGSPMHDRDVVFRGRRGSAPIAPITTEVVVLDGDDLVRWPDGARFWETGNYSPFKGRDLMLAAHHASIMQWLGDHPDSYVLYNGGNDFARKYHTDVAGFVHVSKSDLARNLKARSASDGSTQPTDLPLCLQEQEGYIAVAAELNIPTVTSFNDVLKHQPGLWMATSGAGKSTFIKERAHSGQKAIWFGNNWTNNGWVKAARLPDGGPPCFWTKNFVHRDDSTGTMREFMKYNDKFPNRGFVAALRDFETKANNPITHLQSKFVSFLDRHAYAPEIHIWTQGSRVADKASKMSEPALKDMLMTWYDRWAETGAVKRFSSEVHMLYATNKPGSSSPDFVGMAHFEGDDPFAGEEMRADTRTDALGYLIATNGVEALDDLAKVDQDTLLAAAHATRILTDNKNKDISEDAISVIVSSAMVDLATSALDPVKKAPPHSPELRYWRGTGRDLSNTYAGKPPVSLPCIFWISDCWGLSYDIGLMPQLFPAPERKWFVVRPSYHVAGVAGIDRLGGNPSTQGPYIQEALAELIGDGPAFRNYNRDVKMVRMSIYDRANLLFGYRLLGNGSFSPTETSSKSVLYKVADEDRRLFFGLGGRVATQHTVFGLGRDPIEMWEQAETFISTGHGTSGHMLGALLAHNVHFLWYLFEIGFNMYYDKSIYLIPFNEPEGKVYHSATEYFNAMECMYRILTTSSDISVSMRRGITLKVEIAGGFIARFDKGARHASVMARLALPSASLLRFA